MNYENEITIEVNTGIAELKKILLDNKLQLIEEYDMRDIYMVKDYCITDNPLETLQKCVLIRHILKKDKNIKLILYKYKEYDSNGDIVKQGKTECNIISLEEAKNLLHALGYKELIEIDDHISVYANDSVELAVQEVNNKHIYIELEEYCPRIKRHFNSIEEMKEEINRYNIPIKGNNYFIKKAEIELMETTN